MSISFRVGLLGVGGLTKDELRAVLEATRARSITEFVDDEAVELSLTSDGALDDFPADPGSEPSLRKLFARNGTVRSDAAAAAELCMLVPGELAPAYRIARGVPGVDGWYIKSLRVAIAELEGHCEDTGESCDDALAVMHRAEELGVGVVFGERRT